MDIYDVPIVYEDYIYIREVYGLCQNDTQFDQTLKILALSPSFDPMAQVLGPEFKPWTHNMKIKLGRTVI